MSSLAKLYARLTPIPDWIGSPGRATVLAVFPFYGVRGTQSKNSTDLRRIGKALA